MKMFILFLIICCVALSILAILNTIRFKKLKVKTRKRFYHTLRLSDLHGKDFANHIDYLTEGLK